MKNSMAFFLALFFSILFVACEPDEQEDFREIFVGTYDVTEDCPNDDLSIVLQIEKVGTGDDVRIVGDFIYGLDQEFEAIISGNRITLPTQTYYVTTSPDLFYEFSGDGLLADGEIRLEYTVLRVEELPFGIDEKDEGSCVLTMVKR